ncbi:MAG: hypothetical protein U9R50_10060 [Campylobacterota bacterium]|nr:hypothetical protein [Campylobacterota bacterium]
MLKYSTLILSLLFSSTLATEKPEIQQKEVDLSAFQNQEVLKHAQAELSKGLPKKIDPYTTLISVTTKNFTLIYTYEINTGSKSDEAVQKEDHARMKNAITQGTCRTSTRFLESGISLSYLYNSEKSKVKLFQFDISKKDCPNL